MSKIIMGILLKHRSECAADFQEILTKYGCIIQTRLGLHTAEADACSPHGLIILELIQDCDKQVHELEKEIAGLKDTEVKKMVF